MENRIVEIAASLFPKSRVGEFAPYWEECFVYADINSPARIAMFLAQVGHECAGFTRFEENLNYSAQGLANTWPGRYAKSDGMGRKEKKGNNYTPNDLALSLHRRPEAIANHTYANRMGNGTIASGDGWRYRGRGPKQITGKSNHREATKALWQLLGVDFVESPDLLLEPKYGLWTAVWFWKINRLNLYADKQDVTMATKIINGGYTGLNDRKGRFASAVQQLTKHPANIA